MDSLTFLGRGWKFPLKFENGTVTMSEAEEDIEESLRILLGTHPGERIMRPEFGCGIHKYCFNDYSNVTLLQITDEIKDAIKQFEPRIEIENIDIKAEAMDEVMEICIYYKIIATNSRRNLVYPFYINEATDTSI
ncbi:GPW/gp25 family protein [uncultured Fibrobacter sp.]|uniref:GPW/gp25 family protein n=1 Tax=uncultured Fibrobacter sp. TaxID=261512 RepID=UPI00260A0831|nr:GPW/gp25 family protein [uncultured Fibrobacter sp.]